jgi:hypothetical protein
MHHRARWFSGEDKTMIERDKSVREPREPDDAPMGARKARPSEEQQLQPAGEKPRARGAATEAAAGTKD